MGGIIILVLLLALFFQPSAQAFMNIEQLRQGAKPGTTGLVGAKINGQTGNAKKLLAELSTLTLQRNGASEYLLAGLYRYGQSRSVRDTYLGNVHLRYTRYFDHWPAAEFFAQTEFDQFKRIARRDILGTGLRERLGGGEKDAVFLGGGFFWENEHFQDGLARQRVLRGNLYVSFVRSFTETISGNLVLYYQPSFRTVADARVQVDSSLQIALARSLALAIDWDMQADTRPPPGVQKVDTTYLLGLNYIY